MKYFLLNQFLLSFLYHESRIEKRSQEPATRHLVKLTELLQENFLSYYIHNKIPNIRHIDESLPE